MPDDLRRSPPPWPERGQCWQSKRDPYRKVWIIALYPHQEREGEWWCDVKRNTSRRTQFINVITLHANYRLKEASDA